jgi:hypothetical protein
LKTNYEIYYGLYVVRVQTGGKTSLHFHQRAGGTGASYSYQKISTLYSTVQ